MEFRILTEISDVIDRKFQMTVRASVSIAKGEPIFGSYAHPLDGIYQIN